jgi:sugar-specific transcriptional regulator TrmB
MRIEEILGSLGLRKDEIRLYLTLLEVPPATVSELARETGIHRPLIYRALPSLQEKGLISIVIKGKQKRYTAESPTRVEKLFRKLEQSFSVLLPALETSYTNREDRPVMKYYEGREGIRRVFDDLLDTLKKGEVFYRYSSRRATEDGEKYLPRNYRERRDQKQLERFVITNEATSREKRKRLERALKVIPGKYGSFEYDVTQIIYGSKVAFIDYGSETASIIENPQMAAFQKHLFRVFFDSL